MTVGRQAAGPAAAGRWGQLTYTSFDRHDGQGGGWQVKDTTGDLAPEEVELLHAQVQTQFDSGRDLPRFPTPAEIDALPRRLVHAQAAIRGSETALWHHAPAGNDASGRPGNVFAHAVLDRHPDAPDPIRPIERWRSHDWLTPFGSEQVRAATLRTTDPPAPGPLNRRTIASWLFALRQWRMQTLYVLADALRAAISGGPPVVLGVEDLDETANWIAALSFAMSAGSARTVNFSTLERPTTLDKAVARSLHIVGVPREDLPALKRRPGIVVIDPAVHPEIGDLDGEPHRTARGDRVEVGEWSVLISELFADPETIVGAVDAIDQVVGTVGDIRLDPAWPAAMVVWRRAGADSRREAARVLATCAPPHLRSIPDLYDAAVAAWRGELGGRVETAWRQVKRCGGDHPDVPVTMPGEIAVRSYAELALADEPWLAEVGPARLPSQHYCSTVPDPGLVAIAHRITAQADSAGTDRFGVDVLAEVRGRLHFVELALRLGLAHDESLNLRLFGMCQRLLVPALADATIGAQLAESVDGLVAPEARGWLWTLFQESSLESLGPPGDRLDPAVVCLIGPGNGDTDPLAWTWSWLADADPATARVSDLIGEYAWHRVRTGDRSADARFFAVRASILAHARSARPDPGLLSVAEPLLRPAWDTGRLTHLHAVGGAAVPAVWFVRAIAEARADDVARQRLVNAVARRSDASPAKDFAWVHVALSERDWLDVRPDSLGRSLTALAEGLRLARLHQAVPDRELLRRTNALVVLAVLAARGEAAGSDAAALERAASLAQAAAAGFPEGSGGPTDRARAGLLEITAAEAAAVVRWCDVHEVATTALAVLLLRADPRSALHDPRDRLAGWLHAVGTGEPDSPPLTAMVLAARFDRDGATRDRVADAIVDAARTLAGTTDERAGRAAERFLMGWLRQMQTRRVRR